MALWLVRIDGFDEQIQNKSSNRSKTNRKTKQPSYDTHPKDQVTITNGCQIKILHLWFYTSPKNFTISPFNTSGQKPTFQTTEVGAQSAKYQRHTGQKEKDKIIHLQWRHFSGHALQINQTPQALNNFNQIPSVRPTQTHKRIRQTHPPAKWALPSTIEQTNEKQINCTPWPANQRLRQTRR